MPATGEGEDFCPKATAPQTENQWEGAEGGGYMHSSRVSSDGHLDIGHAVL